MTGPGIEGRHSAWWAVAAAAVLLSGCATIAVGDHPDDATLDTPLPCAQVAWIAAEAVRSSFPAADPLRQHAGAPVYRLDEASYVLNVGRTAPRGYSMPINGRLLPPNPTDHQTIATMLGVRFAPEPERTGPDASLDRVSIRIHRTAAGSRVAVRLLGHAARTRVVEGIREAVHLAEAVAETAQLLRRGHAARAAIVAQTTLERTRGDFTGTRGILRSRLATHLAVARSELGDPAAARRALVAALADDGGSLAARTMLTRLDARTAHVGQLDRNRRLLASTTASPAAAPVRDATPNETARLLADAGDVFGARHWLELATTLQPDDMETLQQLAHVYRQLGRLRTAYGTTLMQVAEHGMGRPQMPGLASDAFGLGQPGLALRWVARQWHEATPEQQPGKRNGLVEASQRSGLDHATRVLVSEQFEGADVFSFTGGLSPHPVLMGVDLPTSAVAAPPR